MTVKILVGNTLDVLRSMPSESVHCCVTSPPYWGLRSYLPDGHHDKPLEIGLEPTPDAFVARLVEVFREVRRVLRKDGTCWMNLGDSYAAGGLGAGSGKQLTNVGANMPARKAPVGLKPKDLVGIPWRVAFALQADGWYLRSDIIWAKPNPMPESVTDRPTKAHEYIFLLTKAERYYYDAEAIKEPLSEISLQQIEMANRRAPSEELTAKGLCSAGRVGSHENGRGDATGLLARKGRAARGAAMDPAGRNKRTVWEVATAPFAEAHFATFPPALIEPMIKAGTSEKGCCAKCGAPWGRDVEIETRPNWKGGGQKHDGTYYRANPGGGVGNDKRAREHKGWSPSCACDAPVVPCTVLDVFGGAGTTGLVADRLQRSAVLIELNPEYAAIAEKRIYSDAGGLFAAVGVDTPKPAKPQAHPSLLSALEATP